MYKVLLLKIVLAQFSNEDSLIYMFDSLKV